MEFKDYYQILGVSKTATPDEIKKQYRQLARKYHPDVSHEKDAEEKFKAMKEAYEVLKDPEKRKAYDQMGSGHHTGDSFTPPPNWEYQNTQQTHGHHTEADFSEFFESLFGQHARGTHQRQQPFQQNGQDQHSKINITLEEAFHGAERRIELMTGKNKRQLNIKIPAGIMQGQSIRLSGQGMPGSHGGKNGDLYLEINITKHPQFSIDQKNIYFNLSVTPWDAALGEKIEVPTLAGKIAVTLPAHSQTNQKIRLKGRGLPGNPPGDQYITLSIRNPEIKTDAQKKWFEKMKNEFNT
ncbi:MAG: cytochrome C biogenesis protein [Gammaproteobacteria bacterium CG_4_10_14_0_8_um_filter_38_16]|nr:MAG: cytochrome C biogenesis protein [Gammaproteobacteria bacterium CG_4_10_14_0_8_um_filter_38_16]PJA03069.1 MAG: cytochrome C biogenesis protein [Gammaproteobacteria bacterium CG_4_10_14_0_2_um_filter_38_22]